jgi:hypothetical protein
MKPIENDLGTKFEKLMIVIKMGLLSVLTTAEKPIECGAFTLGNNIRGGAR